MSTPMPDEVYNDLGATLSRRPNSLKENVNRPEQRAPDPDCPLYLDRRLRALPHGGAAAQGALPAPAGRRADQRHGRAPPRLHAGRPQGDRVRPAAQAHRLVAPPRARRRAARRGLWRRADHAADLEGGACAGARRHPGAHRLSRRDAVRPRRTTSARGKRRCREWSTAAPRSRCPRGRRSLPTGRCRSSSCRRRRCDGGGNGWGSPTPVRWRWSRRAPSARRSDGAGIPTSSAISAPAATQCG